MTTLIAGSIQWLEKIPHSLIAFIARFSIAAVFWKSGQTKIEGLAIDLFDGTFQIGLPQLADSTIPCSKVNTPCRCSRQNWLRTWQLPPSMCSRS